MAYGFLDIASTPSVRAVQAAMGADQVWQDFKGHRAFDAFTPNEAAFIAERDSFYLASVSETGWPYVQHRGGPAGFVRRLDEKTIGWAEFAGNRQYVSAGNTAIDDRVSLFFMDYPHRQRLTGPGGKRVTSSLRGSRSGPTPIAASRSSAASKIAAGRSRLTPVNDIRATGSQNYTPSWVRH